MFDLNFIISLDEKKKMHDVTQSIYEKSLGKLINTKNGTKNQHWFHNARWVCYDCSLFVGLLRNFTISHLNVCHLTRCVFFIWIDKKNQLKNAMRMKTLIVSLDGISAQESWKKRPDKKKRVKETKFVINWFFLFFIFHLIVWIELKVANQV